MNAERTILYNHVKRQNDAGITVTYSSIVKDKALERSNPTIFKTIDEMLEDGTLMGEYMRSDTGHNHLTLFIGDEGNEVHIEHLLKRLINEVKKTRLSLEGFMSGELVRADGKKGMVYHSLTEYEEADNGKR